MANFGLAFGSRISPSAMRRTLLREGLVSIRILAALAVPLFTHIPSTPTGSQNFVPVHLQLHHPAGTPRSEVMAHSVSSLRPDGGEWPEDSDLRNKYVL